jgi:predicted RNA-binding Zn-ribbon protein involved in translation (DUF1610 family)
VKSAEKEKLIRSDILSIENRVRHAFNQGYDLGYKDGIKKHLKTGHWKSTIDGKPVCSECGFVSESEDGYFVSHYCPNCGARMVEPQERSGAE